jgi:exodeoxyribonuclease-3
MQVTLATFNVNSLKARMSNLLDWLSAQPVDILLLQETKTVDDQFPRLELEDKGYNLAFIGQKTYNGVCIASKFPIDDVITTLPALEPDDAEDAQARYIEAVISLKGKALRVASAYVPNGMAVDSDKFPYKLRFFERLHAHWRERLQFHEMAVLGGDFNCAPDTLDVYNAAALEGSICYHPEERTRLAALMNLGLYDAFRSLHPNERAYSWWDYRGGSFERGHGLRIDHMLLSPQAMDTCSSCWIDSAPRAQEKPSDHAPVLVTLTL